jgi:hypothetical protein
MCPTRNLDPLDPISEQTLFAWGYVAQSPVPESVPWDLIWALTQVEDLDTAGEIYLRLGIIRHIYWADEEEKRKEEEEKRKAK